MLFATFPVAACSVPSWDYLAPSPVRAAAAPPVPSIAECYSPPLRRREARDCYQDPSYANADGLAVHNAIVHPYARLYSKKHAPGPKRRKMWNHALEKMLFTSHEISTMGAPHRRTIYTASLEAHIDLLHEQLLNLSLFPVAFEKLDPYRGLNSKTAKSMLSGLQHDSTELKMKILELERSVS
ncbi:hypothetical protein C8Q78DRAFT_964209 [Trametes maxima]|nr:hypothetical protein C8Q78DRAFT_964209 [Trametes maxima]